jgi:choline dehydrogenase-like flavoprotein
VVVVGGGVGGLAAALALGRAGHRVTVLERDLLPEHAGPEAAFVAERPGAPQAHQTHGFLARIVAVLRASPTCWSTCGPPAAPSCLPRWTWASLVRATRTSPC